MPIASNPVIARNIRITGRVQGVGYRAWAADEARTLMLDGWVRNRADGSVEMVVRGAPAAVENMIRRCHAGPRSSHVYQVLTEATAGVVATGFAIMPTV